MRYFAFSLKLIFSILQITFAEELDTTTIEVQTEGASTQAQPTHNEPLSQSSQSQADCESFLANKTILQSCCLIPESIDVLIQQNCYKSCSSSAPRDQLDNCALECYLSITGLFDKDTRIFSKAVAKRIYNFNSPNLNWVKLIEEAVDRCDYVSAESIEQSVLRFYNCVDDYLIENCVSFIQNQHCDSVEEQFENCRAKAYDCSRWPCGMVSPEACCNSPQILSADVTENCAMKCQRKEFLIRKKSKCNFNCTLVETGIVVDGKVSFANIKKVLLASSAKPEWEKSIEKAILTCEGRYRGETDYVFESRC